MTNEFKTKAEAILWQDFIDKVVLMHEQGSGDSEISSHFYRVCVEGEGLWWITVEPTKILENRV